MLWTPHMTILRQKKFWGQFGPKGLFWTKTESFKGLEVRLWSLKRPKHIILTQHIQAHCFKVFWMPTSLFGTIQEGPRGPKKDQIFNFGILDPKNGLSKGNHKNKKVTRDTNTTTYDTIQVLCLFVWSPENLQSPVSQAPQMSTKKPIGPKFGPFSCLAQLFNNITGFYYFSA